MCPVTSSSFTCPEKWFKRIYSLIFPWTEVAHCIIFHNSRIWTWSKNQSLFRVGKEAPRWIDKHEPWCIKLFRITGLPCSGQKCVFWEKKLYCVFWMRKNSMFMNEPGHKGNVNSKVITGSYFLSVNRGERRVRCILFFCFPLWPSQKIISSSHCNMRILLPPGLLLKIGKKNRILPWELLETTETLSFTKSALLFGEYISTLVVIIHFLTL